MITLITQAEHDRVEKIAKEQHANWIRRGSPNDDRKTQSGDLTRRITGSLGGFAASKALATSWDEGHTFNDQEWGKRKLWYDLGGKAQCRTTANPNYGLSVRPDEAAGETPYVGVFQLDPLEYDVFGWLPYNKVLEFGRKIDIGGFTFRRFIYTVDRGDERLFDIVKLAELLHAKKEVS